MNVRHENTAPESLRSQAQGFVRINKNDVINGLLRAALSYARAGKRLFPVTINKRPPFGYKWSERASSDPREVLEHFYGTGGTLAGIGLPTGQVNGVWVLDIDRKKDVNGLETLTELEKRHGPLPETLQQQTGSGGRHYFFALPDGVEIGNSAGRLGPGLDVRGDGGYVIIPPSRNRSGVYRWLNRLPIAAAPSWLLDLVVKKSDTIAEYDKGRCIPTFCATLSTAYGRHILKAECTALAAMLPETGRNDKLNKVAFRLGQLVAGGHLVEQEALSALYAAAESCRLPFRNADNTIKSGFPAGLLNPDCGGRRYV